MTKSANIEAIEAATKITWDEWLEYLDSVDAKNLPHKDIAEKVLGKLTGIVENRGWWAQGVTVAYEQHIGRREPGQRSDGSYEVTVTRTLVGTMDEAMQGWEGLIEGKAEFHGVALLGEPTKSQTDKRRHWGCGLEDGSRVSADVNPLATGKVSLAITHIRLADSETVERWRTYWKELFSSLG